MQASGDLSTSHLSFSAQPEILPAMIQQSFLPYFKPSLPLQDILYEEQPNAKCLCSVNEGTDLGRNHLRRDCLQETVVSSLSMWAAMIECIPIPCALTCAHSKPVIFDLWGLRPSRNQIKAQNTVPQKKNIKSKDPHSRVKNLYLTRIPKCISENLTAVLTSSAGFFQTWSEFSGSTCFCC